MWWRLIVSVCVVGLVIGKEDSSDTSINRGFGDLGWVEWEHARDFARMQKKPLLLLIHKSWCGACQALKAKFTQKTAEQQLKKLSKYFIMTNTEDDDEPWEDDFKPDGKYIPRLMFLSPDGTVLDVVNEKAEYNNYQYYYTNPAQVMTSMRKVMKMFNIVEEPDKQDKPKEPEPKQSNDSPPAKEPATKQSDDAKPPASKPEKKEL